MEHWQTNRISQDVFCSLLGYIWSLLVMETFLTENNRMQYLGAVTNNNQLTIQISEKVC